MTKPEPFIMDAGGAEKRHAPATLRNRDVIADVLADVLPASGTVLEIASGTGEHVVHFAQRFPALTWQPTDYAEVALPSIAAWVAEAGVGNVLPPVQLDASAMDWPASKADAILCINMIHISPWAATEGLFKGGARLLTQGAPVILYGPYLEEEVETAPSNLDFDRSLKAKSAEWGLRELVEVDRVAAEQGFTRTKRYQMPANNLMLVYQCQS